jgi:hypothetical protein
VNTLPPFPLDDDVLDRLEEAIGTCYGPPGPDGGPTLVGGEFTLTTLLDFYSGYDPAKEIDLGSGPDPMGFGGDVRWTEYPDACYSERDVMLALIHEVRRLRKECA